MVIYPQHSLEFDQSPQLLLTLFPTSLSLNDVSCSVQLPFSTISSRTRGKLVFFTPLFTSFSPIIFPCLHLSFNLKPQKKPGEINTVCSPTLQSNCTRSYTMSKQKVQITSFIILTPYSLPFSVLIVLEGTDYIFPFSFFKSYIES